MGFDSLNKWLTLIANLGVLVGIAFLATEINQSNRIAIGTAEVELRDRGTEFAKTLIENPEMRNVAVKLQSLNPELTPNELLLAGSFAMQLSNVWISSESSFSHGLITESTFNFVLDSIGATFDTYPALVSRWTAPLVKGQSSTLVRERILKEAELRGY